MKKFKENFAFYIKLVAILAVFMGIAYCFSYIEEEYELSKSLLKFDIIVLLISPLYYFYYKNKESKKRKKIEEKFIIEELDIEYYRDTLENYSPSLLSFILDGTEVKKDMIASIIYLINKGYLEKNEKNVIRRTDKDFSSLSEDLQFILNNIDKIFSKEEVKEEKDGKETVTTYSCKLRSEWYDIIPKEAVERDLVMDRKEIEKKDVRLLSPLSILCVIETIYLISLNKPALLCFSIILTLLLFFLKYWAYSDNKWIKTQKGHELYAKIVGLKNYIKDFSNLSEGELEKIKLWEDYSVYAIILNKKTDLTKEAIEFYDKLENMLNE